jgi:hypothetical protein
MKTRKILLDSAKKHKKNAAIWLAKGEKWTNSMIFFHRYPIYE